MSKVLRLSRIIITKGEVEVLFEVEDDDDVRTPLFGGQVHGVRYVWLKLDTEQATAIGWGLYKAGQESGSSTT
jgi:hypothetical protein